MMADVKGKPIAEGLFTWPSGEPQLIASRFPESGVVTFPSQTHCPKTSSGVVEQVLLARRGTLWSWTVQGFLPKTPPYEGPETAETFEPYGVGYIDVGDVKVESRLTTADPDQLQIGMEVELVIVPFRTDPDGTEIVSFAFAPVAPAESVQAQESSND